MPIFSRCGSLSCFKAYKQGIRVPTVVWWPNTISADSVDNTPTAFWGWFPTLSSISGSEPNETDGVSLLPVLTGGELPERTLYWEFGNVQAIQKGEWKLLRFKKKEGIEAMLFNVNDDPFETTNLAKKLPLKVHELTEEAMSSRLPSADFPSFLDTQ